MKKKNQISIIKSLSVTFIQYIHIQNHFVLINREELNESGDKEIDKFMQMVRDIKSLISYINR